jgi:rubrerythrin/rubredoxin
MVMLWKCEICGDGYVGEVVPKNCPFCGAHQENIKDAKEAIANFDVELSDQDKEYAKKAYAIERSNAGFYRCASEKTENKILKLLFKTLSKIEAEHASIWRKILKDSSTTDMYETCLVQAEGNLQKAYEREESAHKFYKEAFDNCENQRVKQIFKNIMEIENDHMKVLSIEY